jgi:rubrerythrin
MAEEASRHRAEVEELAAGAQLPQLAAWEFRWPGAEAPESASYEALHYRMTLADAMGLALQNELEAGAFYRAVAERSDDPATVETARRFAAEEARHAAALQRMLGGLPDTPRHAREDDDEPHLPE